MDTRTINVCFLGDSGVGKTTIIDYFINGYFRKDIQSTIGADHIMKKIIVEDQEVQLSLWDTAGQEEYRSITPMTVRNADVCIFVVDASNIETFRDIGDWRTILEDNNQNAKMILAINKIDLNKDLVNEINNTKYDINNNQQSFVETNDFLDEIRNLLTDYPNYICVSALDGTGINDLFNLAAILGLENEPKTIHPPMPIPEDNKKQCC